ASGPNATPRTSLPRVSSSACACGSTVDGASTSGSRVAGGTACITPCSKTNGGRCRPSEPPARIHRGRSRNLFQLQADLAQLFEVTRPGVGRGFAGRVGDRAQRAGVGEEAVALEELPVDRRAPVQADVDP